MGVRQQKGILGEKLGMTQVWDAANRLVPVTVVKAGPCVVTQVRTPERDGYDAVQLGFGTVDPRKVNKPETGHFSKAGVPPRRHSVDAEKGLLLIKGAVPGPTGALVLIRTAAKAPLSAGGAA